MQNWTDAEIIEEMVFIDSNGYTAKHLALYHSPRWWALWSEMAKRHGKDWMETLTA